MVLIIFFNKQHQMSQYISQVTYELQLVSGFLAFQTDSNGQSLSSSWRNSHLDDVMSQQSQTGHRQSSQNNISTEFMGADSSINRGESLIQVENQHIGENTTLNQNKEFKKSSKSHNFPKFFAGDVIRILEEQKNAQQKNQLNQQHRMYMKQYYEFCIRQLKKKKNIICLKNLLISQKQTSKIQAQFVAFLKQKKVFSDSNLDISVLMKQTCLLLTGNKEQFMKMAAKRQIKEEQKLLQYKQFVNNILNDLLDFKMRGKARKCYNNKAK